MAFTGSISITQQATISQLLLTDTSSGGADPNLTSRKVYIYRLDGTTVVPDGTDTDYIDFPIVSGAGDTLLIDILERDESLRFYTVWTSASPIVGATYEYALVFTSTAYTLLAINDIVQTLSADPSNLNNPNFRTNLYVLYSEVDTAELMEDEQNQFSSQSALDRAYQFITNRSYYFG